MPSQFLSNLELQTEQAKAEGYINGPAPSLNKQNISTQYNEGNTSLPTDVPALLPYYPDLTVTPNMGMSLEGIDVKMVNNLQIIDAASLTTGAVTVTLTAAQIASIHTTPIQIVPPPGVGYFVQVQQAVFKYNFGTVQYSNGGPGAWTLTYNKGSKPTSVSVAASTWMTGAQNGIAVAVNTGIDDANYAADLDNAALVISSTNNPSGGDGTISVTVWYLLNAFVPINQPIWGS